MRGRSGGAVLLVLGVVLLRLTLSGAYLVYVRDTLWLPLLASSIVLLALGVLSLVRDHEDVLAVAEVGAGADGDTWAETAAAPGDDHQTADDGHGHGHDHARAPRIGMLLLVPILALLLIAPGTAGITCGQPRGIEPCRGTDGRPG